MGFSRDQLKVQWTDSLVLISGFLCTFAYCYFISRHRILWSDELFGWMLITDPSWKHMLAAWRGGADGGGIFFYTLARGWLKLFGRTVLSFRMFSAAGCFLGFAAAWFALRRFYRPVIAAASLFLVWFGSETILWQMIQTRFYGLVLGGTGCCLLASILALNLGDRGARSRWAVLSFTAVSNLLVVGVHPFGLFFSAAILCGAALLDIYISRPRYPYYLACVIPWIILLFSREAMVNSANVGRPWFWTTRPTFLDLLKMFYPTAAGHWKILFGLVCVLLLLIALFWSAARQSISVRLGILLPSLALALVPVLIWLISQRGTSYFVDRYLIGSLVGIAVLLCEGLNHLEPHSLRIPKLNYSQKRILFASVVCILGIRVLRYAVWQYPPQIWVPPVDFTGELAAKLPRNVPVIFERIDVFDMMLADQRAPDLPMYCLLDWKQVTDPTAGRGAVSGYHEMENWRRFGYFSGSILPVDQFLKNTQRFVAVEGEDPTWLKYHLQREPDLSARKIDDFTGPPGWQQSIWLVQRTTKHSGE